ncbi:MAG: thermonuclease family protein [Bacteriovoracia bacterium]
MKILLPFLALLLPALVHADSFEGKVVAVSDGDTVKVLRPDKTLEKIRLLGIDAPEKKQDFGQKSKTFLTEKIAGRQVRVEFKKRDRYGRLLGKIWKGSEDVNLSQVKAGLAWHYKQYRKEQSPEDAEAYAKAETQARTALTGLWAGAVPTPPWEFRQNRKVASQSAPKRPKHLPRHVKRARVSSW